MTLKKTKYLNSFNNNNDDFGNILIKLFKFNLKNNINSETSLSSSLNSLFNTSDDI